MVLAGSALPGMVPTPTETIAYVPFTSWIIMAVTIGCVCYPPLLGSIMERLSQENGNIARTHDVAEIKKTIQLKEKMLYTLGVLSLHPFLQSYT